MGTKNIIADVLIQFGTSSATSIHPYMAAKGRSIRRNSGGTCSRDRRPTQELHRSTMRLQQRQRQKYGDSNHGEVFVTMWVAHIDVEHLKAFGGGPGLYISQHHV